MVSKIEVGKTYSVSNEPFWEILHIHDDKVMRKVVYKYNTEFDVVDILNISQWKEVKSKEKVYCSIWTQNSGYKWTVSYNNAHDYHKLKSGYISSGYTLIKEWELEYEAP